MGVVVLCQSECVWPILQLASLILLFGVCCPMKTGTIQNRQLHVARCWGLTIRPTHVHRWHQQFDCTILECIVLGLMTAFFPLISTSFDFSGCHSLQVKAT